VDCGQSFTSPVAHAKFCSRSCSNRYHRRHDESEVARRRGKAIVRRLRPQVLARYGHVCGICRKPIPPDVSPNDPHAMTMDHIVPYAQGGQDTLRNLWPAHRACNVEKGDEMLPWWQGQPA
jgi:5-methylcytosine-specific restriction endonuclease McrA